MSGYAGGGAGDRRTMIPLPSRRPCRAKPVRVSSRRVTRRLRRSRRPVRGPGIPVPLSGDHALSGRPVQALHLSQVLPMYAWYSRPSSRLPFSAATLTISTFRAMTSTFRSCAFTKMVKPVQTPDHLSWQRGAAAGWPTGIRGGQPGLDREAAHGGATHVHSRCHVAHNFAAVFGVARPTDSLRRGERRARPHWEPTCSLGSRIASRPCRRGESVDGPHLIAAKRRMDCVLADAGQERGRIELGDRRSVGADRPGAAGPAESFILPYTFTEARAGLGSDLFRYARALVRAAAERAKPNGERLREFTDARLPLIQKSVLDDHPVYPSWSRWLWSSGYPSCASI